MQLLTYQTGQRYPSHWRVSQSSTWLLKKERRRNKFSLGCNSVLSDLLLVASLRNCRGYEKYSRELPNCLTPTHPPIVLILAIRFRCALYAVNRQETQLASCDFYGGLPIL
jgi:hypothetical protein